MTRQHMKNLWLALITVGALLMLVLPQTLTVYAGLPPRPTPEPPVAPSSGGGFIELHVIGSSMPVGPWTVVQWQDGSGNWHTVEGWQGTAYEGNRVLWWVSHADLGKGPFRWVVYRSPGGVWLGNSQSFNLPGYDGATVKVEVVLSQ
jgi:hypothetical protein